MLTAITSTVGVARDRPSRLHNRRGTRLARADGPDTGRGVALLRAAAASLDSPVAYASMMLDVTAGLFRDDLDDVTRPLEIVVKSS